MKWPIAVAGIILVCAASASAQKLDVKIIDRQDKEDEYAYAAVYNNVAVGKSFKVHGATFTLLLPDGRLAIVNCESKFAEHMAGPVGNRRSCRTPVVDSIEADFNGYVQTCGLSRPQLAPTGNLQFPESIGGSR